MGKYLLAHDIGTSGNKTSLFPHRCSVVLWLTVREMFFGRQSSGLISVPKNRRCSFVRSLMRQRPNVPKH